MSKGGKVMIQGQVINNLTEAETERLVKVAVWAFNQGRKFKDDPTITTLFKDINWKTAKYPEDTGDVCFNCFDILSQVGK